MYECSEELILSQLCKLQNGIQWIYHIWDRFWTPQINDGTSEESLCSYRYNKMSFSRQLSHDSSHTSLLLLKALNLNLFNYNLELSFHGFNNSALWTRFFGFLDTSFSGNLSARDSFNFNTFNTSHENKTGIFASANQYLLSSNLDVASHLSNVNVLFHGYSLLLVMTCPNTYIINTQGICRLQGHYNASIKIFHGLFLYITAICKFLVA